MIRMEHTIRNNIKKGMWVDIVLKKDQKTGILTRGQVQRLLTNSQEHHRGIKVMLLDGQVGRVQNILTKEEVKEETLRFYEKFFSLPVVYSLFDLTRQRFEVFRYTNPKDNTVERTALLFNTQQGLEEFIYGTSYYHGDYVIKEIPKDESVVNKFLPLFVEYFRINGERKVSIANLTELEKRYRHFDDEEDFLI